MTADPGRVLGRGVAFPPRVGADGRVAWSVGEANIREAIRIVLLTEPGERLRLDEFGGGLPALLFEPNITTARHLLAERIRRAVTEWEPRVRVRSVEVEQDPADRESAVATVTYELVATGAVAGVAVPVALRG
jgi:phage baseplate assembly protein W